MLLRFLYSCLVALLRSLSLSRFHRGLSTQYLCVSYYNYFYSYTIIPHHNLLQYNTLHIICHIYALNTCTVIYFIIYLHQY